MMHSNPVTEITYSRKYAPLFNLTTRYCIVMGGRGSAKSHAESTNEVCNTFNPDQLTLFTRYTMTSAEISIIPEFWEKVELMNYVPIFYKTKASVVNRQTGSGILFRGIRTSSGNQTASLKSISGVTRWVLDEAEELTDETIFDKIDLSIRKKNADIHVIVILNAPDEEHFIIRRFFIDRGVPFNFNGVHDDCTYIHTTYLDNIENLDESFLRVAEGVKEKDPEKYEHIFMGMPLKMAEGVIYKNWCRITSYPSDLYTWYGVDFGFVNDPTAIIRICFDKRSNSIYLHEVAYLKGLQNADIANLIKQDYRNKKTELFNDGSHSIAYHHERIYIDGSEVNRDELSVVLKAIGLSPYYQSLLKQINSIDHCLTEVYCDSAEQKSIAELRQYGISAYPAIKGAGSVVNQIQFVQYFNIYYTSESSNIHNEQKNYKWLVKKDGTLDNEPMDAFNHAMDGARYGIFTHLTRNGYEYDKVLGAKKAS